MKITINIINILAVIIALFCLFYNKSQNYDLAFVLPLLIFLLNVVFRKNLILLKNSFIIYIVILQLFIRYLILPLLVSLGNATFTGINSANGNEAIFIMGLELIFIYIVFHYQSNKQFISNVLRKKKITPVQANLFVISIILILFILVLNSGFFSKVNFVWELETYVEYLYEDTENNAINSPAGILFTPFKTILILLCLSVIIKSEKIEDKTKLFLSLLLLIISSIFIVGVSRLSIVLTVLPLFAIILYFYKSYKKRLVIGAIAIMIPILLTTSVSKFSSSNETVTLDDIFSTASINAYFSGMGNIATGLDAFNHKENLEYFTFFINDIFQNIPIASKFTDDKSQTLTYFNNSIYNNWEFKDQIVPLSISGIFHLSIFGVFLYAPLFILLSLFFERQFNRSEFIGYKYIYVFLAINTCLVFMLNFSNIISGIFNTMILLYFPFLLIQKFQLLKKDGK